MITTKISTRVQTKGNEKRNKMFHYKKQGNTEKDSNAGNMGQKQNYKAYRKQIIKMTEISHSLSIPLNVN